MPNLAIISLSASKYDIFDIISMYKILSVTDVGNNCSFMTAKLVIQMPQSICRIVVYTHLATNSPNFRFQSKFLPYNNFQNSNSPEKFFENIFIRLPRILDYQFVLNHHFLSSSNSILKSPFSSLCNPILLIQTVINFKMIFGQFWADNFFQFSSRMRNDGEWQGAKNENLNYIIA